MGLRFRKRISIIPGVNLNIGKKGVSVSTGVPGFRKTFHSSGRVTTSYGIPGTGLSYVETTNRNTSPRNASPSTSQPRSTPRPDNVYNDMEDQRIEQQQYSERQQVYDNYSARDISQETIKSIHRTSDEPVDWTEILVNPLPTDDLFDKELWGYFHSVAEDVLNGDIDAYLKVISDVNPLNDLLDFGGGFEFGTDDPRKIVVEYTLKSKEVMPSRSSLGAVDYYNLLRNYVYSCSIRVARDMFALLPVKHTIVHAVDNNRNILSVDFDRATMSAIKFGFSNATDILNKFTYNVNFDEKSGFGEVNQIDLPL